MATTSTEGLVSTTRVLALVPSATYRQLDFWCRKGRFGEHLIDPGSGYHRQWRLIDVLRARALAASSGALGGNSGVLLGVIAECLQRADIGDLITSLELHRGRVSLQLRLWLDDDEIELAKWISRETEYDLTGYWT